MLANLRRQSSGLYFFENYIQSHKVIDSSSWFNHGHSLNKPIGMHRLFLSVVLWASKVRWFGFKGPQKGQFDARSRQQKVVLGTPKLCITFYWRYYYRSTLKFNALRLEIDQPQEDLCEQLRHVVEITRRGGDVTRNDTRKRHEEMFGNVFRGK